MHLALLGASSLNSSPHASVSWRRHSEKAGDPGHNDGVSGSAMRKYVDDEYLSNYKCKKQSLITASRPLIFAFDSEVADI